MGRTFPHVKIDEETDGILAELVHSGRFPDKGTVIHNAVNHFVNCKSKDAIEQGGSITALIGSLRTWLDHAEPAIKRREKP